MRTMSISKRKKTADKASTDQTTEEHQQTVTGILSLPVEIFDEIVFCLSLAERACLALSCRKYAAYFTADMWKDMQHAPTEQQRAYVLCIGRYRHDWFYCVSCVRLHHKRRIIWPNDWSRALWLKWFCQRRSISGCTRGRYRAVVRSRGCLHFCHLNMIMSRHRHGESFGASLSQLRCSRRHKITKDMIVEVCFEIEPGIVDGKLFIRVKREINCKAFGKKKPSEAWTKELRSLELCRHRELEWIISDDGIFPTIYKDYASRTVATQENELWSCEKCYTDVEVQVQGNAVDGYKSVYTRWMRFGAGIDPKDPEWLCHIHKELPSSISHVAHEPGSIKIVFEAAGETLLCDAT